MSDFIITAACFPDDTDDVRTLFVDYQNWLGTDLSFQDFDNELDRLPGKYAAPAGQVLICRNGDEIAGGVAFWPLSGQVCEMKRLFIRPKWRGHGLGRQLVTEIVEAARTAGYSAMRLDTEERLTAARYLYQSFGFRQIDPYYFNPLPNILFLELDLNVTKGSPAS